MSKMTDSEVKAATSDSTVGKMIFESILEDGVFRFDCSTNDRDAAYPSLSFKNTNNRDVPIMSNKFPLYIPSFECLSGQQIVKLEVCYCTAFLYMQPLQIVEPLLFSMLCFYFDDALFLVEFEVSCALLYSLTDLVDFASF